MDEQMIPLIGKALEGCLYRGEEMARRVMNLTWESTAQDAVQRTQMLEDVVRMIRVQTGSNDRKGDNRYGTETDTAL
jgi:hypothetical protein